VSRMVAKASAVARIAVPAVTHAGDAASVVATTLRGGGVLLIESPSQGSVTCTLLLAVRILHFYTNIANGT
jgi:hypothetical protein